MLIRCIQLERLILNIKMVVDIYADAGIPMGKDFFMTVS
jgi:hypothetical protein